VTPGVSPMSVKRMMADGMLAEGSVVSQGVV